MARHDYSPREALTLLMNKLIDRDADLAREIRAAVDAGKDVEERETTGRGRKKTRVYRRAVRLTDEEALQVAANALRAHFVEQPLFVNSAADNFRAAAIDARSGISRRGHKEQGATVPAAGIGVEKTLEIEVQTETQILTAGQATIRLERVTPEILAKLKESFDLLRDLLDFDEG